MGIFDIALIKRYTDNDEISSLSVTSGDILLIRNVETGALMRLPFSTLTTAIASAFKTGDVTLSKGDVGLGNVDNTSDSDKPVSTAQQSALNSKFNIAGTALTASGIQQSNSSQYVGYALRSDYDTATNSSVCYLDSRNQNGVTNASILLTHQSNGGSNISFLTTPSGSKSSNRRATAALFNENGVLDMFKERFRLRTSKTPASATDTGNAGEWCWDSNYIYICTAANTWKRSALSSW